MITSSMKSELTDNLGYAADDIKRMTPLQASLVLNHKVAPAEYDEQLPLLEQEYEAEQERLRQQQEAEETERRQKMEQEAAQQQTAAAQEESSNTFDTASSSFSPKDLADAIGVESGFEDTWYEVVEIKPNSGDVIRQGLYPNRAEADLGLETREMIRNRQMEKDRQRKGGDNATVDEADYSTYEIREISRAAVMEQQ